MNTSLRPAEIRSAPEDAYAVFVQLGEEGVEVSGRNWREGISLPTTTVLLP